MAEYRTIHTKIWEDPWFRSLGTDGKTLFIYLFSNYRACVAGIYAVTPDFIAFETGITEPVVVALLEKFQADGKVMYDQRVVWVRKMRELQDTGSPTMRKRIDEDITKVPDCEIKLAYLIQYGYRIDTVSIPTHSGNGTSCNGNGKEKSGNDGADAPLPPADDDDDSKHLSHPLVLEYCQLWRNGGPIPEQQKKSTTKAIAELLDCPDYNTEEALVILRKIREHERRFDDKPLSYVVTRIVDCLRTGDMPSSKPSKGAGASSRLSIAQ